MMQLNMYVSVERGRRGEREGEKERERERERRGGEGEGDGERDDHVFCILYPGSLREAG